MTIFSLIFFQFICYNVHANVHISAPSLNPIMPPQMLCDQYQYNVVITSACDNRPLTFLQPISVVNFFIFLI